MKPQVEIVKLTPELAASYLERNTHNRNLRAAKVEEFAGAMARGEWEPYNGTTLVFSDQGELLDGQHRCAAVVASGHTLDPTLVLWGADTDAQLTIDSGTKRSLSDHLKLRGETDTANLASALRLLYRYLDRQDVRAVGGVMETPHQLLAVLDGHAGVRASLAAIRGADMEVQGLPRSAATMLHYLFTGVDRLDAEQFFKSLASGANLDENDPVLVLRRRLLKNKLAVGTAKARTPVVIAWTIKAWNRWRAGDKIEYLTWKSGGSRAEDFPLIDGYEDAWSDVRPDDEPIAA